MASPSLQESIPPTDTFSQKTPFVTFFNPTREKVLFALMLLVLGFLLDAALNSIFFLWIFGGVLPFFWYRIALYAVPWLSVPVMMALAYVCACYRSKNGRGGRITTWFLLLVVVLGFVLLGFFASVDAYNYNLRTSCSQNAQCVLYPGNDVAPDAFNEPIIPLRLEQTSQEFFLLRSFVVTKISPLPRAPDLYDQNTLNSLHYFGACVENTCITQSTFAKSISPENCVEKYSEPDYAATHVLSLRRTCIQNYVENHPSETYSDACGVGCLRGACVDNVCVARAALPEIVVSLERAIPQGPGTPNTTILVGPFLLRRNSEPAQVGAIQIISRAADAEKNLEKIAILDGNKDLIAYMPVLLWNGDHYYEWIGAPEVDISPEGTRFYISAVITEGASGTINLGVGGITYATVGGGQTEGLPLLSENITIRR